MASWFSKHARGKSDDAGSRCKTPAGTASPPRGPLMLALEPRMMFDASVAVVADAAAEATHDAVTAAAGSTARPHDANVAEGSGATIAGTADDQTGGTSGSGHDQATRSATDTSSGADTPARADTTAATITSLATLGADALQLGKSDAGTAIVVIDASVDEPDAIVAALPAGTEVIRLNADSDGLAQLSAALAGRGGIGSIQIVTEGTTAALRLGNTWVDRTALDAHSTQLAAIGAALAADGDILVYGCKTADGADGRAFIDEFARLTGADVAASTDWTGAASLGGNWTLEYANGDINHGQLLDATSAAGYDHLLNTLAAGDIVIIGWGRANPVSQGEVYLMSLVDVPAGTTIALTDLGWDNSTGAFQASPNTSEGRLVWTLSSTLQAGDVVKVLIYPSSGGAAITNITDGTTISAGDYATSGWSNSNYVFNANGDSVFIYQDSPANPYFIFGVNTSQGGSPYTVDSSGWNQQVSSNGDALSMLPNGTGSQNALVNGSTAVGFPQQSLNNNLQYNGSTVGTDRAGWLARITDRNNWNGVDLTATETATNSIGTTTGSFGLITAPNHTPTLSLDSGSTSYTENGSAIVVSGGATASDTDGNWNGGTVRLSLGVNGSATDVLGIGASGGITVSGTTVSYGGTAIGTLSAATGSLSGSTVTGSASSALLVTLNGSATDAAVQALVRAFTFANSSDDPGSGTRTVTVAVADALNASASASRSITVTPTNDAPTDITLSNTTVAENSSTPATVGTLGTTDPDSGNTFTYTIVGGADQASFDISGGTLRFASGATLDYETQNSYSVTVRSTDQGGLSTDKTFTVTLSNVNDGPTRVSLSSSGLDASTATANATVGTLTATDPDAGDTLTFSLALGNGSNDADNGLFTISGNTLRVGAGGLAAGTYHVMVRATDSGGYYVNQALVITIATPNVAPTLVLDSGNASFAENGSAIAVSGGATVSDAESNWNGGSVTLALTANGNSSDVLALDTSGSVALAGTTVSVGGTAVGTLSAGSGTLSGATVSGSAAASLVVTLNASATDADVQAIVRALTFGNSGDNPGGATRTLSVTVADNAAGSSRQTRDIAVTPVNDAPTASGGSYSLPSTDEDTASTPVAVASLLGNYSTADADGDTLGIAITAASGNGHWQYSTDGASWTNVGSASASAAVLLDATTRLRYVGDGVHGETVTRPSVSFVAWDGSTGSASVNGTPATADTGASTAFSTGTLTADISVAEVNDAPVLADTTLTLTVEEDSGAPVGAVGSSLADFMGGVSDIDGDTPLGVAISSADEALGTWYYTTDGGGSWNALGAVSESSALLLANDGSTRLFFQTSAGVTGTTSAALGLHAWDGTEGSAGSRADLTHSTTYTSSSGAVIPVSGTSGPASPYPLTISVGGVGTITDVSVTLTGLTHTFAADLDILLVGPDGTGVILMSDVSGRPSNANLTFSDSAAGTMISATGSGTYRPTNVGLAVDTFTGVSGSFGTSLSAFQGGSVNGNWSLYIVDDTGGDVGTLAGWSLTLGTGPSSAFSSNTDTVSVTVTESPKAPVLTPTAPAFTGITEDDSANAGQTVADLLGSSVTDGNTGAVQGIAITGLDAGNGSWEYSLDGTTWTAVGSVSDSAALLLRASDHLRFVPDGNNADSASLTYRAWDQSGATAGLEGTTADTTTHGGRTAFSTATDTATLAVSDVNDAPTLATTTLTLTGTDEDTAVSYAVADLLADAGLADVDSDALGGIAVTALSGNGSWEFSTDSGGTWTAVGSVSASSAALFTSTTQLRYTPDGNRGETAGLSFAAWDRSSGSASSGATVNTADTTTRGGTTAFSTATATASLAVSDVNDAPVVTVPGSLTVTEDVPAALTGISVGDVDAAGGGNWLVTLHVDSGTLHGVSGFGVIANGDGTDTITLLAPLGDINGFLAAGRVSFTTAADATADVTLTVSADDNGNNGSGGALTDSDSTTIRVTPVNDAPVLTDTTLAISIEEDSGAPVGAVGSSLADFMGGVSDIDGDTPLGVAIGSADEALGTWYYTTDGGSSWNALGAVSESSALLLANDGSTRLFFQTSAGVTGTTPAALGLHAWDGTEGSAGSRADLTGGSSAYSHDSDTVSVTVTESPKAPVLTPTAPAFTGITEDDSANAGQTVADLLGSSVTDGNTGAVQGIAITGLDAGNGSWEYSLDGTTWTAVGGVSDSAALLLRASDHLRFVPDGINADAASLTYRAWDQSGATAGLEGTTADTTTHGGRTAFSTATDTATLAVSDVNDAPTLATTTLTLAGTDEDTSVSYTVADLLADAGLADADSGALGGIAVTALTGNGSWEFSTDSGGTWTAVGSVSAGNAALFTSTTQLRYVPDGNRGETAGLSFAAWDRSSGSASAGAAVNTADTTTRGGTTAFSTATASASLAVSDVNDAPTLATTTLTLAGTDEDTASAAITVADLLADAGLADADSGALGGIAVTTLSGNGSWQFSTDGGASWTAVGGVSTSSAALFTSTTQLRYTPDGLHGETASLGFAAWDRSTGSASTAGSVSHADASTRGGGTAFSADLASASLAVGEVNDLPTLATSAGSAVFTEAGGAVVIDSGITLADIDGQPAIDSATVAITGGRAAGDVLGFANDGATMGDIAASWDAGSGRLTLSSAGGATLAQWQAALRAVSFDNGSALVADGARTVSFSVTDAGGDSSAGASRAIGVSAIDQPASLGNLPDASTYTEGDAPTVLAPDLTVLDPESAEAGFDGASVTLVNHAGADARDLFGATGTLGPLTEGQALVVDGVTVGSVSRNSGGLLVLDFSGADATLANVQAVLRQIGYSNASDAPPASATLDWRFTPASGAGATGATDISLVPVNDTTAFAGGGGTTAIDDTGSTAPFASLVVTDPDTQGATVSVTLTDALGAGDFTAGTSGWTRDVSGNDIVWTRGFASTDNIGGTIQAALRGLVFTPTANALPSGTTRSIGFEVTVDDGGGTPVGTSGRTVTVSSVNDAPVLDHDSFALDPTDEDTARTVSVADLLAAAGASDADAGTALGLAVTFTSGRGQWQYSTDSGATWHAVGAVSADAALTLGQYGLLRYTPDGIEADLASINFVAWDASAGTLTDGATRGTVDAGAPGADGATSATTAGATLSVTDVNDAPTLVVPDRLSLDEDGSVVITGIELRDVDGDLIVTIASGGATPLAVMVPGPVSVSFSVPSGMLTAAPGEGVTITTAADGTVTLTGQLNRLNAWLAAGNLSYTAAPNANGEVALSVRFDDGGNIGGGSLVATAEVVLDIAAVNDAPTVTAPADADVGEGLSVSFGSATGNAITLADIDAGDGPLRLTLTASHGTLTLGSLAGISFLSGDGTADASLVIEGNLAALRAALDGLVFSPAAGYHGAASIGLVLNDLGNSGSGGALVADTSIDIAVSAAPRATGVSLVGDDNGYKAGDTVLIEVDYDSALVLDTTGGSPTLALNVGGTTRLATLVSSDGGKLVFGYTVLAGDSTADLALAGGNALSLNGATLRNATGSNAVLALPTPSGSGPLDGGTPVVVDGVAPVVTSVTLPADGLYGAGNTLDFTVNLSEAVTLDTSGGTPRIAVSIGGTTVYATYVGGSGGNALGFRLVLPAGVSGDGISLAGNLDFNGATVRDALGNPANPALHGVGTAAIAIDGQAPTAGTPATGTAGPTNATSLDFTVVFDEAVSGVDAADFTVRGTGSASGSITGVRSTDGGKTWIVTVAAGGDGTLAVDLDASGTGITDAAGNAVSGGATGTPVAVDHGLPTVDAITLLDAQTTGTGTLRFQIRFSEGVSGLDPADLALVLGDSATGRITGLTQVDARTWVVTVDNVAGNGSVALRLVAAGSGIADTAGNTLAADATSPAYTHVEAVVPVTPPPAPPAPPAPAPMPAPLVPVSSAPVLLPVTALPTDSSIPVPPPAFVPPPAPRPTDDGIVALSFNPALDQPLAARPFSGSFSIGAGRTVSFGIPDGSFVVRDPQAQLTLSARQSNGQPLPAWLRFDPLTGRFSGTVPPGLTGRVRIQVLLRDSQGHMVSTEIEISLGSTRAALPTEADQLALAALLGDLATRPDADRDAAPADRHASAGITPAQRATARSPHTPAEATAHAARAPLSHQLDRHGDAGFADELAALLGAVTRL